MVFFLLSTTNRNFSASFDRPVTFTDEHERDPPLFSRLIIGRFIAQLWDRRLRGVPIDGAHQAVECHRFPVQDSRQVKRARFMVSVFMDVSNKSSPFLGSFEANIERVSQTEPARVLINSGTHTDRQKMFSLR
jgi:hypothetical protein